ncbi:unnamed protein product [Brachionus calyciflorus]|uniref:Uncharacterized protein n=1 Tax=Brachionus calyciflorus TaxID=104777 RepID=A0A814AWY3_9BILA|nr:unnamed protein product [Brachionus calyciflorus]
MLASMMVQFETNDWESSVSSESEDENEPISQRIRSQVELNQKEKVSLEIPKIDRSSTDLPRLPGIISRVSGDFYEITTKYGILNICYRASDLEPYSGPLDFDYKTVNKKISLREASHLFNKVRDDVIVVTCDCKGACSDNRCKCFKNEQKCSSHFHLKVITNKKCKNYG